jgi:NADPH-dependent 7-cyano-7-deazaguanine reductase QueF
MKNIPVVDQPHWPALDAVATPARMSFKMVWKSTGEPAKFEDASKHFRFTGFRATCQMEAQVDVASIGFSWKSDPLDTSKCDIAYVGDEVNGRYYDS